MLKFSVRDHIRAIQTEVDGDLMPDRGTALLMMATALIGNVADEIRAADLEYSLVLLECFESEEKANRAKIRAEEKAKRVKILAETRQDSRRNASRFSPKRVKIRAETRQDSRRNASRFAPKRAKIRAETTPEFQRKREARDTQGTAHSNDRQSEVLPSSENRGNAAELSGPELVKRPDRCVNEVVVAADVAFLNWMQQSREG